MAQFPGNSATAVRNPMPESVFGTVRHVPGVAVAFGQVQGYAQFVAPDGTAIPNNSAPTYGIAFDPDRQISELRLIEGKPPTTSHDVVMDAGTAKKYHFRLGQSVRILSAGPPKTYTITGIAQFGNAPNLAGATLAAFTFPTAQAVIGEVGQLDYINVVAKPGADKAVVQHDIARALPAGTEVVTGSDGGTGGHERGRPSALVFLDGVARVRLYFPFRRRIHHFQHVLDHRRPAHPGAGAIASGGGQPAAGVPFRAGRGRHRGRHFFSDRDRPGRPGRLRARKNS